MELAFILLIVASIVFYFLPGIIAAKRDHHNRSSILLLNLLAGWTLLGWIVAIVWAASSTSNGQVEAGEEAPALAPKAPSIADELQKLADLRDKGILTQEEFDLKKSKMLA